MKNIVCLLISAAFAFACFPMSAAAKPTETVKVSKYGYIMHEAPKESNTSYGAPSIDRDFPSQFDLRDVDGKNYTTPIRDQGNFGTCWAHASISSAESYYLSHTNANREDVDFSESAIVMYANNLSPKSGFKEGYTVYNTEQALTVANYGGYGEYSMRPLMNWEGLCTESSAPYLKLGDKTAQSIDDYMDAENIDMHVTDIDRLPSPANGDKKGIRAIKAALMDNTESVCIDFYASNSKDCANTEYKTYYNYQEAAANHAVAIVGWDDSCPKEYFAVTDENGETFMPENDGAWIVRNSWGDYDAALKEQYDAMSYEGETLEEFKANFSKHLGYDDEEAFDFDEFYDHKMSAPLDREGYFRLSYYDASMSGAMTYKYDIKENGYEYDNNYQYDYLNIMKSMDSVSFNASIDEKADTVANVFSVKEHELLKAVSAYTFSHGNKLFLSIYKLNENSKTPQDGELVYEKTEKLDYAGFHNVKLDSSIELNTGDRFAVVERILDFDGNPSTAIETGCEANTNYSFDDQDRSMTFKSKITSDINEGESYILTCGNWVDISTVREKTVRLVYEPDDEGGQRLEDGKAYFGNAMIKAYTKNLDSNGTHSYSEAVTAPTCKAGGYTTFTCDECGYSYVGSETAPVAHSFTTTVVAPTESAEGYTKYVCKDCGLTYGSDFTAKKPSSNGSASEINAAKQLSTSITSLKGAKKSFKAKWGAVDVANGYQLQYSTKKKFTKKTTKTVTLDSPKTTKKTVKKLKAEKTYYVRVRTYKKVGQKTVYGKWSKVKKVTTKK